MKKTKRFAAAVAALAMAVSMMTVTSFASATPAEVDTTPVTASDATNQHVFAAVPIFLGDIEGNTIVNAAVVQDGALSLAEIAAAAGCAADADINTVLTAISAMTDDSEDARAFAKALAAVLGEDDTEKMTNLGEDATNLENGYYLIVEMNRVTPEGGKPSILRANILKVFGGTELDIESKTDYPTLVKKVGEEKATEDAAYGKEGDYKYNDVADHSVNESVPFKLYGTLPSNIDKYPHYMYKITDKYDSQLSIDKGSIVVKINGTPVYRAGEAGASLKSGEHGLTVTFDDENHTFVVNFVDIKVYGVTAGSQVTVEYQGALNNTAYIAADCQENGAKLGYSLDFDSNVEWDAYEGPNEQPDTPSPSTPGYPDTPKDSTPEKPNGDEEDDNGGETPEDKVRLYTYKLQITKTDGTAPITGPAALAAKFTLQDEDGCYIKVTDNYVEGFYTEEQMTAADMTVEDFYISLNDAGILNIVGLDDGAYTITEVVPPTDYKLPEDNTFGVTITGGIVTMQTWDNASNDTYVVANQAITVDGITHADATAAGVFKGDIENALIGSLPSTGGMGTKLFIICGGSLALASGVILIAKKRSKKEEQ